jgi:hypothetical protein
MYGTFLNLKIDNFFSLDGHATYLNIVKYLFHQLFQQKETVLTRADLINYTEQKADAVFSGGKFRITELHG